MDLTRQQKLAYAIVGVLLVVFIGVLLYLQIVRVAGRREAPVSAPTVVEGLRPDVASEPFDTSVLQDPRYQELDRSLFEQGRLPVPVPAVRGRPNLF